jgi:hypothetical protein
MSLYGPLPFNLDFFTECLNLAPLVRYIGKDIPGNTGPAQTHSQSRHQQAGLHDNDDDISDNDVDDASTPSAGANRGAGVGASTRAAEPEIGMSKLQAKFQRMSAALCEVVDDYGLVSFHPMNIEDVEVCCFCMLCMFWCVRCVCRWLMYVL